MSVAKPVSFRQRDQRADAALRRINGALRSISNDHPQGANVMHFNGDDWPILAVPVLFHLILGDGGEVKELADCLRRAADELEAIVP